VLRTIEVGHIFKLGRKFTDALGVRVLKPDGGQVTPIMGSYGIGVERAIAAIAESHHDDAGLVWPVRVAPFAVAVVVLDPANPDLAEAGEAIADRLRADGIDVIVDDRVGRPGVRFRDIELTGIPFRVTVGARDLADGAVELAVRATGAKEKLPLDAVTAHVAALVRG
jgi:prolyl-tRNA synthetase